MPICQFIITIDDLINNANETKNGGYTLQSITVGNATVGNPGAVARVCNLPQGKYICSVSNCSIVSGAFHTNRTVNPQLITIDSSRFLFPNNGVRGLTFSNTGQLSDISGRPSFEINIAGGLIDLSIQINQYGTDINANNHSVEAPWTLDTTATWTSAEFAYILLTLDVVLKDSHALFNMAKNIK
jgi:hypothetical protein